MNHTFTYLAKFYILVATKCCVLGLSLLTQTPSVIIGAHNSPFIFLNIDDVIHIVFIHIRVAFFRQKANTLQFPHIKTILISE